MGGEGAGELRTGESMGDYADGIKIAQRLRVRLTAYVSGGSHHWVAAVQSVLDSLQLVYTLPQREYLQDINKVSWMWEVYIRTPVEWTEAAANG